MNPTPLPVHEFSFEGRTYLLFKRDAGQNSPWYFRYQHQGSRKTRGLETNIAANAVVKAKAMISAAKNDRWTEFLEKTTARPGAILITRAQIAKLYREYPNRRPSATTRTTNLHALDELCGAGQHLPGADTAYQWKQSILQKIPAECDEARHRQLLRSANSRLVQARSVFTADLQVYYKRTGKLHLPAGIADFLKEPKFPADETGRTDYWPAPDAVITKTFEALERLNPLAQTAVSDNLKSPIFDLNLYLAVWLTLGFGLRKSEIAACQVDWFVELNGHRFIDGKKLGKNRQFPRVLCQLGAWAKLAPHLAGRAPGDYILAGTAGERCDQVFRRCSHWMRGLGWTSEKAIHELRSYAGCQIAMGDRKSPVNLRAAQEFLRHANITTTENFYMRYLRSELKEVTLHLPVAPAPFVPQIVHG